MIYKLVSGATTEPVTIEQARTQIGLASDDTSSDALLISLIAAARGYVENYTHRALITQIWEAYMDTFENNEINLFKLPVAAITSVKYYDANDVEQTLEVNTDYVIDIIGEPARLFPAYGKDWPNTYDKPNAVQIVFTAGYGDATKVPDIIKAVILMIVAHLEANRGDEGFRTLPPSIALLLNDYRLERI